LYNFKSDLQAYQGQQNQGVGESSGSQVDTQFMQDLQNYRQLDSSPLKAEQAEYNQKVENTRKQEAEENKIRQAQMESEFANMSQTSGAPSEMGLTPNIEIDYAGRDLSREDIKAVKEGTVGGQCGVYAQNVVKLPGGKNWNVGDSIQQKAASVNRYRENGLGFYPGEDLPKPGNTVILNPGHKYGHVAVINSINPDGTMTLTESNLNWDGRVTHSRTIPMNNKSIVGYIRTQ
jgi:surface antigen